MVHTSGTQSTTNDSGHIRRSIHLVLNIGAASCGIGLFVVGCASCVCLGSHFVGTIGNKHGIPAAIGLTAIVILNFSRIHNLVVERLDHTAILARESAAAFGIRTLLRDEHRVLAVAEIVAFDESRTAHCHTHAILRNAIEIVVINVEEHRADARMTRIAMVEPVVMIGVPAGYCFALHATEARLACVEEVVVRNGNVLRFTLDVHRAVTLGLIGIAARLAVEEVAVMNPHVRVARVERDGIVHAANDADVANLYTFAVTHQHTEAVEGGIFADALDGDGHVAVFVLALHLQAFATRIETVHIAILDSADHTNGQWRRVVAFLIIVDDVLQALCRGVFRRRSLHVGAHRLGIICPNIDHLGTLAERTIILIGTDAFVHTYVRKA